ncbi:MAG: hypothetical protein ACSHYB_15125 [Roseibacillus sp.]
MARRPKNNDEGVNLDSLMDALTNVVAVLILVLILVQTEVTQKVQEFFDNLEPATPEQVEESQKIVAELEKKKEEQEEKLKEDPPTPEELEEEKRKLALLEKDAVLDESLLADLAELKKLETEARKKRDTEQEETNLLQKEIAELEARLDDTPVLQAEPPTVVTIPNSRDIPANATIFYALVMDDRVHFIDPYTPAEKYYQLTKKNRSKWLRERIKRQGADRYILDHTKVMEAFQDFDFGNNRGQKVHLPKTPSQTRLALDTIPDRKEGGTSLEELSQPNNKFIGILKVLARDRKAVLMFKVNPNSFNTYLVARELADKANVPAGWEVNGWDRHRHPLMDVEVNRLEEPPEKPPTPRPPRVGPKLD